MYHIYVCSKNAICVFGNDPLTSIFKNIRGHEYYPKNSASNNSCISLNMHIQVSEFFASMHDIVMTAVAISTHANETVHCNEPMSDWYMCVPSSSSSGLRSSSG